jgi:hypothetical protein
VATALRQAGIVPSVEAMQKPLGRAAMRLALEGGRFFGRFRRRQR